MSGKKDHKKIECLIYDKSGSRRFSKFDYPVVDDAQSFQYYIRMCSISVVVINPKGLDGRDVRALINADKDDNNSIIFIALDGDINTDVMGTLYRNLGNVRRLKFSCTNKILEFSINYSIKWGHLAKSEEKSIEEASTDADYFIDLPSDDASYRYHYDLDLTLIKSFVTNLYQVLSFVAIRIYNFSALIVKWIWEFSIKPMPLLSRLLGRLFSGLSNGIVAPFKMFGKLCRSRIFKPVCFAFSALAAATIILERPCLLDGSSNCLDSSKSVVYAMPSLPTEWTVNKRTGSPLTVFSGADLRPGYSMSTNPTHIKVTGFEIDSDLSSIKEVDLSIPNPSRHSEAYDSIQLVLRDRFEEYGKLEEIEDHEEFPEVDEITEARRIKDDQKVVNIREVEADESAGEVEGVDIFEDVAENEEIEVVDVVDVVDVVEVIEVIEVIDVVEKADDSDPVVLSDSMMASNASDFVSNTVDEVVESPVSRSEKRATTKALPHKDKPREKLLPTKKIKTVKEYIKSKQLVAKTKKIERRKTIGMNSLDDQKRVKKVQLVKLEGQSMRRAKNLAANVKRPVLLGRIAEEQPPRFGKPLFER